MKEKTKEMIGKNLRTKRKEHGFTQEKLAEKAGVNVRSIQRIEQGMEQPELDMLSKIGAALQIDWQELIYGSEPIDYIEHERKVQLIIEHCNWREKKFIYGLLDYVVLNIKDLESQV